MSAVVQPSQPDPLDPLDIRCSDNDRERVAEVLRDAASDGRLSLDELEERLQATFSAKTFRELQPITQDLRLPAHRPTHLPAVPERRGSRIGGVPAGSVAIAVFGGATRRGDWVVPAEFVAFAMFGGVELDLRNARFAEPEVTIFANAVFGGVDIAVPDDVAVQVDGIGLFGGYDSTPGGQPPAGAPVVRIKGFALFGGVSVKRKPPRTPKEIGRNSNE